MTSDCVLCGTSGGGGGCHSSCADERRRSFGPNLWQLQSLAYASWFFVSLQNYCCHKNLAKWEARAVLSFSTTKQYSEAGILREIWTVCRPTVMSEGVVHNRVCSFKSGRTNSHDRYWHWRLDTPIFLKHVCLLTYKHKQIQVYKTPFLANVLRCHILIT